MKLASSQQRYALVLTLVEKNPIFKAMLLGNTGLVYTKEVGWPKLIEVNELKWERLLSDRKLVWMRPISKHSLYRLCFKHMQPEWITNLKTSHCSHSFTLDTNLCYAVILYAYGVTVHLWLGVGIHTCIHHEPPVNWKCYWTNLQKLKVGEYWYCTALEPLSWTYLELSVTSSGQISNHEYHLEFAITHTHQNS